MGNIGGITAQAGNAVASAGGGGAFASAGSTIAQAGNFLGSGQGFGNSNNLGPTGDPGHAPMPFEGIPRAQKVWNKGTPYSETTKRKISEAMKIW